MVISRPQTTFELVHLMTATRGELGQTSPRRCRIAADAAAGIPTQ